MTNVELIDALRHCLERGGNKDCRIGCPYVDQSCGGCAPEQMLHDAADALEAAETRIAELEKQHGNQLTRNIMLVAQLPKEGEWIWDSDTGTYHCSECNATSPQEDQDGEYIDCPNYCQNCGARMRCEHDE